MPKSIPHVTGEFRTGRFDFDTSTLALHIDDAVVRPMPIEAGTEVEVLIRPARKDAEPNPAGITLGDLIDAVEALPSEIEFIKHSPGRPHSYRSHYPHLAIDLHAQHDTRVKDFLETIMGCDGRTFEGYKGGDFTMTRETPVFIAGHGTPGDPILGVGHSVEDGHAWLMFDQGAPND